MKALILVPLYCLFFLLLKAGNADTIAVYSPSMHKAIKCVVITPSDYLKTKKRYPVVYLLHGFGGNYARWLKVAPQLKDKADELQFILICPDGGYSSWYFDNPAGSSIRYETFTSKELPAFTDSSYKTIADRNHRAITGLSMGGHGSLYISIRHKDMFGAAGSASGVVDVSHFPKNQDVKTRAGDSSCCTLNWEKNSVINLVDSLKNRELKLIIDCGIYDILILSNRKLHEKLLRLGIEHDYIERPGTHNSAYWKNSIDYQLLFFKKFFDAADNKSLQKGRGN
jgi:S-formylglutathione hydrolase FrmB